MPKMTKAQAKKRLNEAAQKVANVWASFKYTQSAGLSVKDTNELVKIHNDLTRLSDRIK